MCKRRPAKAGRRFFIPAGCALREGDEQLIYRGVV